jgi:Protein of unknown function (DUF3365)
MVRTSLQRLRRSLRVVRVLVGASIVLSALSLPTRSQSTAGSEALALPDLQVRLQASREAVRSYSEQLKFRIAEAIKTGGIKGAIGSCKSLAPELNSAVGDASNLEIARTALRLRNPDNAPDTWEMTNLESFLKQLNAGGDHKTMEIYDVLTTKEGQRLFRYMKPIVTGELCLGCHGAAMPQEIKLEIARNYPEDKATGFNLGELRGAFTVVQEVE